MKALCGFSLLAVITVMATGCASVASKTGIAWIGDRTEAITATSVPGGSKTGRACSANYLGIYGGGDSSIEAAKKAGGISTVSSVDEELFNVLGFYSSACTVVKGN